MTDAIFRSNLNNLINVCMLFSVHHIIKVYKSLHKPKKIKLVLKFSTASCSKPEKRRFLLNYINYDVMIFVMYRMTAKLYIFYLSIILFL